MFAALRQASDPDEFRSNLHMGGTATEYPLTDEIRELCHRVSKAIGLRMAGIDLLFGEDGFVVGEVNSTAGFDSWLGKKDIVSIFIKDLKAQMMKQPLAHELEDGKNYELVLTTNAGLYRYRLKDLVHVEGFTGNTPNIYFLTKLSDIANLAQEKIPGTMLLRAIQETAEELGAGYGMAQVYPDPAAMSYIICLETERDPENEEAFAAELDEGLRRRLEQYDTYRNKLLSPCSVKLMKKGWGNCLMKKYAKGNATEAQVKIPVVIDTLPEEEWNR